ncbi:MAG: FAD-dependent oxidoreductase [Actinobacteria bacterium]|nr:FAD-dependent oxidoreductase [Actinomycetota bacterium]
MADVVILGAGVSGHTAALHLSRMLGKRDLRSGNHSITVVSPNADWNWIPSNIWVGVGKMEPPQVLFPLQPVYEKRGVKFVQARATAIRPYGTGSDDDRPSVEVTYTGQDRDGESEVIPYDYLINATGPKLRFEATPGLGPDHHSYSVCTASHAADASAALGRCIESMKDGNECTLVVGMGHGTCTCEGAAFEYAFNVDHELREAGVREQARLVFLTNEAQLGDFGVDGLTFEHEGFVTHSELWASSLFRERQVEAIVGAHVERVDEGTVHYETLDGEHHSLDFDFAMLLPPFGGVPLKAYDRDGEDITDQIFAPSGFMKVDADYTPRPYEEWTVDDWPETYMAPGFDNVFATGIAFAPPHQISRPRKSPNGTVIAPSPPRTGMPSGVMGKTVATTIARKITDGEDAVPLKASMGRLGAACIASSGAGLRRGTAAAMSMLPVVPDYERYETGRDLHDTRGEIGLAGHWLKLILHYLFIYKAKGRFGWHLIPE